MATTHFTEHFYYVRDKPPRSFKPYPYPPSIMVKHALWYLPDADLFITVRSILFGLHHSHFVPESSYFQSIMDEIEPCRTAARGSNPSLPIAFNGLECSLFTAFLHLLYYPDNFQANEYGWYKLKSLARDWKFPRIAARAFQELEIIERRRRTYVLAPPFLPNLTEEIVKRQRDYWRSKHQFTPISEYLGEEIWDVTSDDSV